MFGEWTRDEADAERAAGDRLEVQRHELYDDGDAEGCDGEVVGSESDGERTDQERDEAGGQRAADPAHRDRKSVAAETVGIVGRGEQRRDVCADGDETGNADIEQAGLAPLHVEAKADDGIGQRHCQEKCAIAQKVEAHSGLPKIPCGRNSSTSTRMTKATAARHSAPTS